MNTKTVSSNQRITVSAMVMAMYVIVMYITRGFSFGAYQIRIATSLYALSYLFPFLVLPLGLSNCLTNLLFGGMGPLDIFGGLIVGLLTAGINAFFGKKKMSYMLTALPIIFIPGMGVALWLSYLLNIPYSAMALSLVIGQIIPGIFGAVLVKILKNTLFKI